MKRTIAIVCGGDTSEFQVSLRSAQGIYSFIDKEKYTLYIVEMHGLDWHVQLPDGGKAPIDRNDFSFQMNGRKVTFDLPTSPFTALRVRTDACKVISISFTSPTHVVVYWQQHLRMTSLPATNISKSLEYA